MKGLRRFSGVGALLFAVIFVVAALRGQALAFAAGDDELCLVMGGNVTARSTPVHDPGDLADRCHACCDLGLCLDGVALPPSAPAFAALARLTVRVPSRPAPPRRHGRARRAGHRPRDPPRL